MSIGAIQNEADLRSFIQRVLADSPLGVLIRQLQGQMDMGTDTLSYTASVTSASTTVNHNLGHEPQGILFANIPPLNTTTVFRTGSKDDSQFTVTGYQADDAAITQTQDFFWLAIG